MPIYEYKCTICHERFDVEQSIKDDTLTTITGDDHEHTVKKVFHPVGIAFRGDGFYKNDTRDSSKKKTPSSGSDSSSNGSSSSTSETSSSSAGSSSTTTATTSTTTSKD